jgi:hypothetical protein
MAKRSYSTLNDKSTLEPPKLDIVFKPDIIPEPAKLDIDPKPSITYNKVTNLLPSRVIREIGGRRYEWQPGQTINILAEDTDALRNLTLGGRACCGGANANHIFEVLEV